ncbi:hypothetical protein LCGC14_1235110 [marine sediment metagenome]|uniref:Uncharacterized protein n=1 Tax=marine sediment metagenome TaxID=412755 RepID=A0A0F9LUN2_9ZZZZ
MLLTEFSEIRNRSINLIFKELGFCIMTANCNFENCIEIQKKIDEGFLSLSETELSPMLKHYKYRFYNIRSKFILEARNQTRQLEKNIKSNTNKTNLREQLVENIKNIGCKEASHFLRNIGYID